MITKQEAIERANALTLDNIRYYMGNPTAKYERCAHWHSNFILWIVRHYVENRDNFAMIIADYNTAIR